MKMRLRKNTILLQSVVRMFLARLRFRRQLRAIVRCQSYLRRRLARRVLRALREEARDVVKYRETSFRLEKKVVELSQEVRARADELRATQSALAAADERARATAERTRTERAQHASVAERLAQAETAADEARHRAQAAEAAAADAAAQRAALETAAAAAAERAAEAASKDQRRVSELAEAQAQLAVLRKEHEQLKRSMQFVVV